MPSNQNDNLKNFEPNQNLSDTLAGLRKEIQLLYASDNIPWVLGYSGGKDSTAVVQIVWEAIAELPNDERKKPIYVITTDTLVENPVVSGWVSQSLVKMREKAEENDLPIYPKHLKPALEDTFWVNLIGKGYPAPRPKFRWCTERLKIRPVDNFIRNVVGTNGEAIVVLGTRKAESSVRAHRIEKFEQLSRRENLSKHMSIESAYVYAPISDWNNDDVWLYLMQVKNPWGHPNKDLLTMYQGATADGECPLVVDTTTPSCGSSRFGCWVCTLVDQDKSMTAMIHNDQEKSWMLPLLKLRNELDSHDHDKRDHVRLNGSVMLKHNVDELVPGPYTQKARSIWLKKLLSVQEAIKNDPETPAFMENFEIITKEELNEIRRIWLIEKYEIEDLVPKIYKDITGKDLTGIDFDQSQPFGDDELSILKNDVCAGDLQKFSLLRNLLEIERRYRSSRHRAGLMNKLEEVISRGEYADADAALAIAKDRKEKKNIVENLKDSSLAHSEFNEALSSLKQSIS